MSQGLYVCVCLCEYVPSKKLSMSKLPVSGAMRKPMASLPFFSNHRLSPCSIQSISDINDILLFSLARSRALSV